MGRGYGTKKAADNFLHLDIRTLKRDGMLMPGRTSRVHWTRRGSLVGEITVFAEVDRLFVATLTEASNGQMVVKKYPIQIERTACHLGGQRLWFWCPGCGRRVAVLYGHEFFACRHCRNLAYACQRETPIDRAIRRADSIRKQLGWTVGIANPKGCKPKGMHWNTYWQLQGQYDALVDKAMAGTLALLRRKR